MDLRQKIIKLTGEDPADMFGEDWKKCGSVFRRNAGKKIITINSGNRRRR